MADNGVFESKDDFVKVYFKDFITFSSFNKYSFRDMQFFFEIFKDFFPKELTIGIEFDEGEGYDSSPMNGVLNELVMRQEKWVKTLELENKKLTKNQVELLEAIKRHNSFNEKWELFSKEKATSKKERKNYYEEIFLLMQLPKNIQERVWGKKDQGKLSSFLTILSKTRGRFSDLLSDEFFKNSVFSKGFFVDKGVSLHSSLNVSTTKSAPEVKSTELFSVQGESASPSDIVAVDSDESALVEKQFLGQLTLSMSNLDSLCSTMMQSQKGNYSTRQKEVVTMSFFKNISNQLKICDGLVESGKYVAEISKIMELALEFTARQKKEHGYRLNSELSTSVVEFFEKQTMSSIENMLNCIREKKIGKNSSGTKNLISKIKTSSNDFIIFNKFIDEYNDILFEKRPELLVLSGARRIFFFELNLSDLINSKRLVGRSSSEQIALGTSASVKIRGNVNVSLNALSTCLKQNKLWNQKTKEINFVEKEALSHLSFDWVNSGADGKDYKLNISLSGNVFDNSYYYNFVKGLIDEAVTGSAGLNENHWNSKIEAFCLDRALRLKDSKKLKVARKDKSKSTALSTDAPDAFGDECAVFTTSNEKVIGASKTEVTKKVSAQNLLIEKAGTKIKSKVSKDSIKSNEIEDASKIKKTLRL